LLKQGTGAGVQLAQLIRDCVSDASAVGRMEQVVTTFYKPDAAREIVQGLITHA